MKQRSERGFTLVELMIVVAIIALLSTVMFGLATRPYNANAQAMSEKLTSVFGFARMRAISTRKVHRVTLYNATTGEQVVTVDAASVVGMPYSSSTVWQTVEVTRIPSSSILWSVATGAVVTTGAAPTRDTALNSSIYFKPDGSATASTVYITDQTGTPHYYRVLVYHATGSSYAREVW